MNAMIGQPVVVYGPIFNGSREHAALVTRVFPEIHDPGCVRVNLVMFPDGGGESHFHRMARLFATRDEAVDAPPTAVAAYMVRLEPLPVAPVPVPPPQPVTLPEVFPADTPITKRGPGRPRKP